MQIDGENIENFLTNMMLKKKICKNYYYYLK